jgi:microcystin-dependent protein
VSNQYLGEIRIFPYNFAPSGWQFCAGQTLSISQNTALFSLLGTTYGGNGTSTFQLPDLRGRVPLGQGSGPGLQSYVIGEFAGVESVTLSGVQMPTHSHPVTASEQKGTSKDAGGHVLALGTKHEFATAPDGTIMNAAMISSAGGSQPHENRQPFLVLTPCIAMQGIFPSRN